MPETVCTSFDVVGEAVMSFAGCVETHLHQEMDVLSEDIVFVSIILIRKLIRILYFEAQNVMSFWGVSLKI
ncbi:hypothetical protein Pla52o_23790 [Novipirellula galeiformis]|uniref:Uncharacterized protein n=1 Tax=Novipirellula galeiformis TaxID=2528004 RepID=A0A5C6CJB6_9BACT|nr:hypothetical protein Pla52o_23790 [Novipirellula galeiformis]